MFSTTIYSFPMDSISPGMYLYLLPVVLGCEIFFVMFLFSDKKHSEGTFKFNSMITFQEKWGVSSEKREGENSSQFNFLLLSFLFIVRNLYT